MFTTYILYSQSARRYHVGSTQNFSNRLDEHNSGETKSIRFGIPWNVVWLKGFPTRSESLALEQQIKARGIARFLVDNHVARNEIKQPG